MRTTTVRHFLFGYGSLINPQSRAITVPSLKDQQSIAVSVKGLKRSWCARVGDDDTASVSSSRRMTAVGVQWIMEEDVEYPPDSVCNGVLIELQNPNELELFDEREGPAYQRVEIPLHLIRAFVSSDSDNSNNNNSNNNEEEEEEETDTKNTCPVWLPSNSSNNDDESEIIIKVWVYVIRRALPPNRVYPIAQSYVDIILQGCHTVAPGFANDFVKTTRGWEATADNDDDTACWVNDRSKPLYIRADPTYSSNMAEELDRLLERCQPVAFSKRTSG